MSLSGTRGLVRVSKIPGCELQAAMVVERVREPDFYRRMTGTKYPGEYGERQSARRRGSKFENNLHMNDAALLRQALAPVYGFDPEEMRVRNFEDELPGAREGIRAARLARTRRVLRDLAEGREVPHLLIQPQLRLPIGPGAEDFFYVGPDFMVLDPAAGIYVPGEEKSFIVRAGEADPGDLELTRRQAATQILALRFEADLIALADRVLPRAVFVMATPYGLRPAPAVEEALRAEVREVGRAINAICSVRKRLGALRAQRGDTALENLAEELQTDYQEACVGACVLAGVCKEQFRERARSLGDAAAEVFGADMDLDRLLALANGGEPRGARERELAEQLQDAADVLDLRLRAGGAR